MKAVLSVEAKKLNSLGIAMAVFGAAAVVWVLVTALMDLDLAVIIIPGILLWIPAMICGAKAEQIKRDNKLYTYRAVEAFMNGEDSM